MGYAFYKMYYESVTKLVSKKIKKNSSLIYFSVSNLSRLIKVITLLRSKYEAATINQFCSTTS